MEGSVLFGDNLGGSLCQAFVKLENTGIYFRRLVLAQEVLGAGDRLRGVFSGNTGVFTLRSDERRSVHSNVSSVIRGT